MRQDNIRAHVYTALLKREISKSSEPVADQLWEDASQLRENLIEIASLNLPAFVHKTHEKNLTLVDRYIEAAAKIADLALTDQNAAKLGSRSLRPLTMKCWRRWRRRRIFSTRTSQTPSLRHKQPNKVRNTGS
jgi:hypothetical protein